MVAGRILEFLRTLVEALLYYCKPRVIIVGKRVAGSAMHVPWCRTGDRELADIPVPQPGCFESHCVTWGVLELDMCRPPAGNRIVQSYS